MNASKEECQKAMDELANVAEYADRIIAHPNLVISIKTSLARILDFLEKAKAKLPTENAFANQKTKKK